MMEDKLVFKEGMPEEYGEYLFVLIDDYEVVMGFWDSFSSPHSEEYVRTVDISQEKFFWVHENKIAGHYSAIA